MKKQNTENTLSELSEFIMAISAKIGDAEKGNNFYLSHVLKKILRDMNDLVQAYETSQLSFEEAYEEITHLYVFSEIYLDMKSLGGFKKISNHSPMSKLNILLVDDSEADAYMLKKALNASNIEFELTIAESGDEALETLKNNLLPDIMLLDINMPIKNGKEILREMQESHTYKQIPVIMFSTSLSRVDHEECMKLNAKGYVSKPLTFDGYNEIIEAIQAIAQGSEKEKHTIM